MTVLPSVAETVTVPGAVIVPLVEVKFALVCPAAMVTLAGTGSFAASLLDKVTVTPPAGAGDERFTVPVKDDVECTVSPPFTLTEPTPAPRPPYA